MDTDIATTSSEGAAATTTGGEAPSGTETTKDSGVTVDRSAADTSAPVASANASGTEIESDWAGPKTEPDTGIALEGDYPANLRLRAERLFDAGLDEDPDGILKADDIKGAGERVTAERAHEELSNPAVSAGMKVADLERIALAQGIDISAATKNDDRVRIITEARAAGVARPANEEAR